MTWPVVLHRAHENRCAEVAVGTLGAAQIRVVKCVAVVSSESLIFCVNSLLTRPKSDAYSPHCPG